MVPSYHGRALAGAVERSVAEAYPRPMFRRGKGDGQSAADADRQALYETLAQRPETVCPFLGLAAARADYDQQATDDHRCFAFGDPEPVSGEQQRNVCLQRGYANCPRYLRGVLVIPSDELDALRHPPQRVPPPPPPPAAVPPSGGGRRRSLVVVLLLLLLVAGGAGVWWIAVGQNPVAVTTTPSPLPSPTPSESSEPSQTEAESPLTATPSPDPTPEAGDEFIGYEVTVVEGNFDIFKVNDAGTIVQSSNAFFNAVSQAPVDRIEAANGLVHWRVTQGETTGWSYIHDQSGPFRIRAVYRGSDGSLRYSVLGPDEI